MYAKNKYKARSQNACLYASDTSFVHARLLSGVQYQSMGLEGLLYSLWRVGRMQQFLGISLADIKRSFNTLDSSGKSVVHQAVERGNITFLNAVLEIPGINVNAADDKHDTPLMLAIRLGRVDAVRLLLSAKNIDVNKLVAGKDSALHIAVETGQHACMRLLLSAPKIDVNTTSLTANIPLLFAAINGDVVALQLLCSAKGIDLNISNDYGNTALQLAAWKKHVECVRYLASIPGVDFEHRNARKLTALQMAAYYKAEDCMDALLPYVSVEQLVQLHDAHERFHARIKREIIARCVTTYVREDLLKCLVLASPKGWGHAMLRADAEHTCGKQLHEKPAEQVSKPRKRRRRRKKTNQPSQ